MGKMKELMSDYADIQDQLALLSRHEKFVLLFFGGYNPSPLKEFKESMFWDKIEENIFFRRFVVVNHQKNFLRSMNADSIRFTKRTIHINSSAAHIECELFLTMTPEEVNDLAQKVFEHLDAKRSKAQALDMLGRASRKITRIGDYNA